MQYATDEHTICHCCAVQIMRRSISKRTPREPLLLHLQVQVMCPGAAELLLQVQDISGCANQLALLVKVRILVSGAGDQMLVQMTIRWIVVDRLERTKQVKVFKSFEHKLSLQLHMIALPTICGTTSPYLSYSPSIYIYASRFFFRITMARKLSLTRIVELPRPTNDVPSLRHIWGLVSTWKRYPHIPAGCPVDSSCT